MISKFRLMHILLFIYNILIYGVFFYVFWDKPFLIDFSSFYSSVSSLVAGRNPYEVTLSSYLDPANTVSLNLNPPFFLLLMLPFSELSYRMAFMVWSIMNLLLSAMGFRLVLRCVYAHQNLNGSWIFYLSFFAFFGNLINSTIGQLGGLMLFLTMLGYYFFQRKQNIAAGVVWGCLIAIKFFPALLMIYVGMHKRYCTLFTMMLTTFVASLLPLWCLGSKIYLQYLQALHGVTWYWRAWNASLWGFIYRLFSHSKTEVYDVHLMWMVWIALSGLILIYYIQQLRQVNPQNLNPKPFCLTLVIQLLLSPLAWVYYFPLLLFPLVVTWRESMASKKQSVYSALVWITCLFFLNYGHITNTDIHENMSMLEKLEFSSFYFYGLIILLYLVSNLSQSDLMQNEEVLQMNRFHFLIFFILFVALIPYSIILLQDKCSQLGICDYILAIMPIKSAIVSTP